jgi:hypothetical protein
VIEFKGENLFKEQDKIAIKKIYIVISYIRYL